MQALPVEIAEHEKAELCDVLGKDCVKKAELENEKKEVNKQFKEKIDFIQEEIDRNSQIAAEGAVYRQVTCKATPDYSSKTIQVVRLDTGEVVEERPMTIDELAHIDMNLDEDE